MKKSVFLFLFLFFYFSIFFSFLRGRDFVGCRLEVFFFLFFFFSNSSGNARFYDRILCADRGGAGIAGQGTCTLLSISYISSHGESGLSFIHPFIHSIVGFHGADKEARAHSCQARKKKKQEATWLK